MSQHHGDGIACLFVCWTPAAIYNQFFSTTTMRQSHAATASTCSDERSASQLASTIALFGVTTPTGRQFVKLALDAGYHVRCFEETDYGGTTQVKADTLIDALPELLKDADFVVCFQEGDLALCKALYQHMVPSVQVLLWQTSALAPDARGKTPLLARLTKTLVARKKSMQMDRVVAYITRLNDKTQQEGSVQFDDPNQDESKHRPHYIVTRPSLLLREGPISKKLQASKSVRSSRLSV